MRFFKKSFSNYIKIKKAALLKILIFISIFLFSGELAIRLLEYFKYSSLNRQTQYELYKKLFKPVSDKPYRFEHRPNVDLVFKKGYYQMRFITNSEGLREVKDYGYLEKSVIFIGDSIVAGSSVDNDQTFESIFERLTRIPSLNFGVGSSNTKLEFFFLKEKYKKSYNTVCIVLGFFINDWDQSDRCFDENFGNWRACDTISITQNYKINKIFWLREKMKYILHKSKFMTFLFRSLRQITGISKKPYSAKTISLNNIKDTGYYIAKIKEFADSINARFVVLIFPIRDQFFINYNPGERQQDILIKILEKHNIEYFDLYPLLKQAFQSDPSIYWDIAHPHIKGHKIIGEFLSKNLKINNR